MDAEVKHHHDDNGCAMCGVEPPYPPDLDYPDQEDLDDPDDKPPAGYRRAVAVTLAIVLLVLACTLAMPKVVNVRVLTAVQVVRGEGDAYIATIEYEDDGVHVTEERQITAREFLAVRGRVEACLVNGELRRCE